MNKPIKELKEIEFLSKETLQEKYRASLITIQLLNNEITKLKQYLNQLETDIIDKLEPKTVLNCKKGLGLSYGY